MKIFLFSLILYSSIIFNIFFSLMCFSPYPVRCLNSLLHITIFPDFSVTRAIPRLELSKMFLRSARLLSASFNFSSYSPFIFSINTVRSFTELSSLSSDCLSSIILLIMSFERETLSFNLLNSS